MTTNASTSRGRQMVNLALNIQLRERLHANKKLVNTKNVYNDPDYDPKQDDFCSESSSAEEGCISDENSDCLSHTPAMSHNESLVEEDASVYELVKSIVDYMVTSSIDIAENNHAKMYTKKGTIRRRTRNEKAPAERKKLKLSSVASDHKIKKSCNRNTCMLKCSEVINEARREDINKQYWELNKQAQRLFVHGNVKQLNKRKNTVGTDSRRKYSYKYYLRDANGLDVQICKTFFLATLGYDKSNDRFLKNIRGTDNNAIVPKQDQRGHRPALNFIDKQPIVEHIKSFRPTVSHYRREHAPNRLYLPSDISITMMYNDYKLKNPDCQGSYELYRQEIAKLNISFAQLGCEECFQCASYDLHKTEANHINPTDNCLLCENYVSHRNKYITARKEYERDAELQLKSSDLIVSADLQKVIMLPRADMFKEVIFSRRIIAFNESFVAVGKGRNVRPLGILWHEGVSGRKKEDIVSTFYAFFLKNRDKESITIWLDNCSGQNKNWCLFSFFVYIVNATEVNLKQLTIKYFERGHTFMSADHFHHQVEKSLKRAKTVWDFNDYVQCVLNSTKHTDVVALETRNFYEWTDFSSKYKLQKVTPRCYLNNISLAIFTRGEKTLKYKNSYNTEDLTELNFLTAGAFKTGLTLPPPRTSNRGISQGRKQNLLNNLHAIIPANRRNFWEELPVGDAAEEDENGDF